MDFGLILRCFGLGEVCYSVVVVIFGELGIKIFFVGLDISDVGWDLGILWVVGLVIDDIIGFGVVLFEVLVVFKWVGWFEWGFKVWGKVRGVFWFSEVFMLGVFFVFLVEGEVSRRNGIKGFNDRIIFFLLFRKVDVLEVKGDRLGFCE